MPAIENYEIIAIARVQQVAIIHNYERIYSDYQGQTIAAKQNKKDLLVYTYRDNKEIIIATYKDFNFSKVRLMEYIKAAEISRDGEVVNAVKILLGNHAKLLYLPAKSDPASVTT